MARSPNDAWGREPDFDQVGRPTRIATKGGRLLTSSTKNRHSNAVRGCVTVMRTSANADMPLSVLAAEARKKAARDRAIRAAGMRHSKLKVYKVSTAKQNSAKKPNVVASSAVKLKTLHQLNRSADVVSTMLGDRTCVHPEKVCYKKGRTILNPQVGGCELRVRMNGQWYSVQELLSVGLLDERFAQYAGLISGNLASIGRSDLERHFQIGR